MNPCSIKHSTKPTFFIACVMILEIAGSCWQMSDVYCIYPGIWRTIPMQTSHLHHSWMRSCCNNPCVWNYHFLQIQSKQGPFKSKRSTTRTQWCSNTLCLSADAISLCECLNFLTNMNF